MAAQSVTSMRVGFIGLGKLGLPCAVTAALKGHDVVGYDHDSSAMTKSPRPYRETGPDGTSPFDPFLAESPIRFGTLRQVIDHAEILFVAVQTPHAPQYEGTSRLPEERADFDYSHLVAAMGAISEAVTRPVVVAIISTVLPGTVRRHVLPVCSPHVKICYTPSFIAMGTTMKDYLNPEFVLLGVEDPAAAEKVSQYFSTITSAAVYRTSVESAELIKVAYNTYIGMKIVFANSIMEICHRTEGADVDDVMGAIKMAHRRLISPSYLDAGMGDGGGCHPRDNIAMSWLARDLNLSFDFFDALMTGREKQTEWLADLMCEYPLPKAILGYSFKPNSNITVGSPALLLKSILEERGHRVMLYDPHVDGRGRGLEELKPHVFLIGTKHPEFVNIKLPEGSVVLDPWRYLSSPPSGVTVVPIGGKKRVDSGTRPT